VGRWKWRWDAVLVVAVCAMVEVNAGHVAAAADLRLSYVVAVASFRVTWATTSIWHLCVGVVRQHWFAYDVVVGSESDAVVTVTHRNDDSAVGVWHR